MDFLTSVNFWLWVVTAITALFYVYAFYLKVIQPAEKTAQMMPWVGTSSPAFVRTVGFVDLAGGLGLVLPVLTGILPFLTPLAAIGTLVLQVFAIVFHARRGETAKTVGLNIILLAFGAFILWGRWSLFGG